MSRDTWCVILIEKVMSEGLSALFYILGSKNQVAVIVSRRDRQENIDQANDRLMTHAL